MTKAVQSRYFPPVSINAVRDAIAALSMVHLAEAQREQFLQSLKATLNALREKRDLPPGQKVSENRARELLLLLRHLQFVSEQDGHVRVVEPRPGFDSHSVAALLDRVLVHYNDEEWFRTLTRRIAGGQTLHDLFVKTYRPYAALFKLLDEIRGMDILSGLGLPGVRFAVLLNGARGNGLHEIGNTTRLENMLKWGEALGMMSMNGMFWRETVPRRPKKDADPFTDQSRAVLGTRYYTIHTDTMREPCAVETLNQMVPWISRKLVGSGMTGGYIDIAYLREFTCELKQTDRERFDEWLIELWRKNPDVYEFVRAASDPRGFELEGRSPYVELIKVRDTGNNGEEFEIRLTEYSRRSRRPLPPLMVGGHPFHYLRILHGS